MTGQLTRLRPLLRWRSIRWALGATTLPVLLWACTPHPLMEPNPVPETETIAMFDINPGRQLDLLFMIDNSSSMEQEQASLARNFPLLITELEKIPGGLPDIHVAVISSNFGAGPNVPAPACNPYGDRGRFLVKPGCGLDPSANPWLEQDINNKKKNFTGDLATTFSCIANLGSSGCGYEHQLQALRASLYDVNPENRGFLRDTAYLGIIMLSDEDDCSGEPFATFFDQMIPSGQASSLTCSLLGHVCNGQEVPAMDGFTAPLTSCVPYERAQNPALDMHPEMDPPRKQRLINVSEFVDYIKKKKDGRPDRIIVSAIVGWPKDAATAQYKVGPVMKTTPPRTELDNVPICMSANGTATAGVRLKHFVDAFGDNGSIYSICQDDYRDAITDIGNTLAKRLNSTCINAPLIDTDPKTPGLQPECQVVDRTPKGMEYSDVPLPPCTSGKTPCWALEPDMNNEKCGSGYHVVRTSGASPPPVGTLLGVRCLTCTSAANGKKDPRCTVP